MSLDQNEQLLLEAVKSMLSHDAKLGLSIHDKDEYKEHDWRGLEYLHEHINEMFLVKAADLTHAEGVCQAFNKVHSYKYLDDPSFSTAMEKEMVAQAIPANERAKALNFIPKIIKELKEDQKEWAEKDSGFNPLLDEIKELSKPEQPNEFEIHDMDGYNDKNVKSKFGDASPDRTPSDGVNKIT